MVSEEQRGHEKKSVKLLESSKLKVDRRPFPSGHFTILLVGRVISFCVHTRSHYPLPAYE